ncbi:hypothetical protein Tco_1424425, partial [Tanacetum coccineum]
MLSEAQGVSLRITSGVRVRTVYHDLYLGGKALTERENVGNHPEDDFTPLETIRRSYSVIREKIPFELEGRPSSQRGG